MMIATMKRRRKKGIAIKTKKDKDPRKHSNKMIQMKNMRMI